MDTSASDRPRTADPGPAGPGVFSMDAPEARDPAQVGGKGAALARARAAGFDVPAFIVLGEAAFADTSPAIDIDQAVRAAGLGDGPFAVRSSARDEDGAMHSHAGQFESVLRVARADLAHAAARVRASADGAGVAAYQAARGVDAPARPAVIVQKMIAARAAGVAFSADPVSGLRDRVVVAATHGTAENLVAGHVDGARWVVHRDDTLLESPPDPMLDAAEVRAVAALARQAEAAFGAPQDIEWALDGDRLVLVQARPVTTPLRPAPVPDTTLTVFDNSNIVESYPGCVSPLTTSFAMHVYDRVYRAFVQLLGVSRHEVAAHGPIFANLLARIDGRIYYNLGNWYRALALLPGFALNRAHMETMMGVSEPLPAELSRTIGPPEARGWRRLREMARLVRPAFGLMRAAVMLGRTKRGFQARLEAALARESEIAGVSLTELAQLWRQIESELLDRWDAPLVNDFLCMMAFGASRKMLERAAGAEGVAFHNDLMIGQGAIVSAEPARQIARIGAVLRAARLEAASFAEMRAHPEAGPMIAAYLARFGDRCTEELKLESLTLHEDPGPLHAALQQAAQRKLRATTPDTEWRATDPAWESLLPDRPLRRRALRALTHWARDRVRDRENLRFERTRIFGMARRVFLAMGREMHAHGVLEDPRDIFLLTVNEILGVIEGHALSDDLAGLVARRKREEAAHAARPDPDTRLLVRGPARLAPVRGGTEAAPPRTRETTRHGTGCAAGRLVARARVITDPRTQTLESGDILVARNTDPGWIALFSNAGGIVVEKGSLLSHSAIVAREMGIPCVVGLGDATTWIPDGAWVRLDGATGAVELLPAPPRRRAEDQTDTPGPRDG